MRERQGARRARALAARGCFDARGGCLAAAGPKSGPKKGPRKGREMYTHIAWLNAALTAIFVLELVWITVRVRVVGGVGGSGVGGRGWEVIGRCAARQAMLWPRGDVPLMLGLGAAVSAVATVTVALFKVGGVNCCARG